MVRHRAYAPLSYAVSWRDAEGRVTGGELELGADRLRLEGADRDGTPVAREIPYGEITSVRIGRSGTERIDGRSTVVIEPRRGLALVVTSAVGFGTVQEIAERLASIAG